MRFDPSLPTRTTRSTFDRPQIGVGLGWATDLAVLRLHGAVFDVRPDHMVVRTPGQPDFHWANFVMVTDPAAVDDAARWVDTFDRVLPGRPYRAIGLARRPAAEPWAAVGVPLEVDVARWSPTPPLRRPIAPGYAVRRLAAAADWSALLTLYVEDADRPDAAAYGEFMARRVESFARLSAADRIAFFGAFDAAGRLVAGAGIARLGVLARYQSVTTARDHRRRGLAARLLHEAGRWAAAPTAAADGAPLANEVPVTRWVILVEVDSPAERLYRNLGFVNSVPAAQAYQPPA